MTRVEHKGLPDSLPSKRVPCQADEIPRADSGQGEPVSLTLRFLRAAIDELAWKHDAIACALGVTAKYLSRMLAGEKPWTVRHLRALPDDVEALFIQKYAESFGLICVAPVDADTARRHLVSGLVGVLTSRLPAKADRMAKATLKCQMVKATV